MNANVQQFVAMPRGITGSGDTESSLRNVATTDLRTGRCGVRSGRADTEESLRELANSIAASGVIQPIIARRAGPSEFEVVAGERRVMAAKLLNMPSIPCLVRDCSEAEALVISLTENVQRKDLNPVERAQGMSRLLNEFRLTQHELAERIGMSQPAIAHHLRLLTLPDEVQCLIEDGALSFGHGKVLAGVADKDLLVDVARTSASSQTSVRDLEALVASRQQKLQARLARNANAAAREEIELPNGVFLVLKEEAAQPGCGKIEIPYYSERERDWVMRVLSSADGAKPWEAHKARGDASLLRLQSPIALSQGVACSPRP